MRLNAVSLITLIIKTESVLWSVLNFRFECVFLQHLQRPVSRGRCCVGTANANLRAASASLRASVQTAARREPVVSSQTVSSRRTHSFFVLVLSVLCGLVSGGKCYHVCPNKVCLPKSSVCDGILDCKDRSDELNCTRSCEHWWRHYEQWDW